MERVATGAMGRHLQNTGDSRPHPQRGIRSPGSVSRRRQRKFRGGAERHHHPGSRLRRRLGNRYGFDHQSKNSEESNARFSPRRQARMTRLVSIATKVEQLNAMLGTSDLTDWEQGFVRNVAGKFTSAKTSAVLTDKQIEIIER